MRLDSDSRVGKGTRNRRSGFLRSHLQMILLVLAVVLGIGVHMGLPAPSWRKLRGPGSPSTSWRQLSC